MAGIQKNISLAPYTTFKIGGSAKYFAVAKTTEEIKEYCRWAMSSGGVPVFILGGGSNILVSDNGFNGLVIKNESKNLKLDGEKIFVDSGILLSQLVAFATDSDLSGLEWAVGIPGTVGGAICGNAGAYGKEMSNSVEKVWVLDTKKFSVKEFKKDKCGFKYRSTCFKNNPRFVILSAVINLKKDSSGEIKKRIVEFVRQRTGSFSPNQKCAGCFFKNLEWGKSNSKKDKLIKKFPELEQFRNKPKIATGFLIEFLGSKGQKVGDAMVSNEHANFIINSGKATAKDVLELSGLIKDKVRERYGFKLEEEVCLVGF